MALQRRFKAYDLAVLGAGPGGYVAAIRAAQHGLKTALIEKNQVGGTCLNVGCIPSKSLLNQTAKIHDSRTIGYFGISIPGDVAWDWQAIQNNKNKTCAGLARGILGLLKKHGIDHIKGPGKLVSGNAIQIDDNKVEAKNIILATGSIPGPLPGVNVAIDEKRIVTSTGALALNQVPKHLIIIGGGAIGLEFASIYSRVGARVTVVEFMDQVANGFDKDVSALLMKTLDKLYVKFHLNSKVTDVKTLPEGGIEVVFEKDNAPHRLVGDVCLISTGRKPNIEGVGIKELGIKTDKIGRVLVDSKFNTNVPSVKAIGDLIPGPMLAHKAEEDGCAAVAAILGKDCHVDYGSIPGVIYTHPEAAIVGASEAKLKELGVEYSRGFFPLVANSRSRCNAETDGFVKVLVNPADSKLLGATFVAQNAGDLIQELVLAKAHGISAEAVGNTCHAHPSVSEAVKEACMAAAKKPGAVHI